MTRHFSKGFTLIEVMAVTLFLAIIGTYTWGYLRSTITTQRKIEERTTLQQTGISIITKLQDDISQVFFVESNQKMTFFQGGPNEIAFSTLSHDAPSPQDKESEEAEVYYTLEGDKDDPDGKTQMLMRKEVPYLFNQQEKDDQFQPIAVAKKILSLDFTYSDDGSKFLNEWDTAGADHPNKLPKLVKIKLVVRDFQGHEEYFESQVTLPMTDDLNTQAAAKSQGKQDGSSKSTDKNPAKTQGSSPTTPNQGGPGGIK